MKLAAAINLLVAAALAWLVGYGISLDTPIQFGGWVVTALMLLAGIGALMGAGWGPRLGQVLGGLGCMLGVLTIGGGVVALTQSGEFSDLAGAVLLMLGTGMLICFAIVLVANTRARAAA